jgi:hypothetical protein
MTENSGESEVEIIEQETSGSLINNHCSKVMLPIAKGKKQGVETLHFKCNYCKKAFVGPSNSSLSFHLIKEHPSKCSDLIASKKKNPKPKKRNLFDKTNMKGPFHPDIFMGKLLKWIVKSDQAFSTVDNEDFNDMLEYLKTDITVHSRRTIMRRLEELYVERKGVLRKELQKFNSKFSLTCDVWTSKNQLSFFGFTVHFIDDKWKMQQRLLAFKYLTGDHDGVSLGKAMIEVLEDFGIAERLLGVTADNASNNSTMLAEIQKFYDAKYPASGFSVEWNQVECVAHVLNLGAQQILKNCKQPVDSDNYEPGSDSSDQLVTAVSRLAFLCRKIRLAPKLRRLMETVCKDKQTKYLVPIIDVVTRWNSTYDMLVRALKYKDILSATFYRSPDHTTMIPLLLNENDWHCIAKLINVLQPLKEATLMVSKGSQDLMISNVIPIYHACTELLKESLTKFKKDDDIYIGIEAAIEKLTHYYDMISPMVGISLILNPTLKKDFLKTSLDWKSSWVGAVEEQFISSFKFYKAKTGVAKQTEVAPQPEIESASISSFLKRKRDPVAIQTIQTEEEFQR